MHVLFLPSIYPTADEPWRETGVRDQALALRDAARRELDYPAIAENVPLRRKEVA